MPFWEDDLPVFFADFPDEAIFNPDSETPTTCNVLFNSPDTTPDLYGEPIPNQYHELTAKSSDVAEINQDDSVQIKGKTYRINYLYEDETGLTRMRLRKA